MTTPATPATRADSAPGRERKPVLLVFGVALVARLLAVWFWLNGALHPDPGVLEYVVIARNLVFHGVFGSVPGVPDTNRPPLYPALIAALWRGADPPYLSLCLVQALAGAATAAFVYRISRRYWSGPVAWMAALGTALSPLSSRFTANPQCEVVFAFFVAWGLWEWGERRPWLAGFALGLAALTHSILVTFVFGIAALAILPCWRRRGKEHLIILAAFLLTVSPWTARNIIRFHRPTLIADSGWRSNLLYGTLDLKLFVGNVWSVVLKDPATQVDSNDAAVVEKTLLDRAIARIRANPAHWVAVRFRQYPRLFADSGEYIDLGNAPLNLARKCLFYLGDAALVLLAVFACLRSRSLLVETVHIWFFPLFVLVSHLPMWVEARRLIPAIPELMIWSAVAIPMLLRRGPPPSPRVTPAP